ncbi:membrane protein [Photobacterium aquae]|uniref:Membrane protein n=1 Tax=Photobacterium aquae TaxID=1195763 RepID=A0A0J1H184_9GAMM|nr:DUF2975 domain-containing protein [Photobacterium aquae]KLV05549.1 membrane protein [Photobacterium aquae]
MSNIQKQSRRVRIIFQCLLIFTPIVVCYYWITINTPYDTLLNTIQFSSKITDYTQQPLSTMTRVWAGAASLLLSGVIMYALIILIRLFRNYEQNNIFTIDNVGYYKKLGFCVFYWVGGSFLYTSVISIILSFNNPPGERLFVIGFTWIDMITLLLGGVIVLISWVMKEGCAIADENSRTI